MLFLMGRMKKTVTKVDIRYVRLKQTKQVAQMLEALSSCEVLKVLHLKSIYIPHYDFRFVN